MPDPAILFHALDLFFSAHDLASAARTDYLSIHYSVGRKSHAHARVAIVAGGNAACIDSVDLDRCVTRTDDAPEIYRNFICRLFGVVLVSDSTRAHFSIRADR